MSIRGTELMECTMSVLHDAQEMVGGGLVYLECEEENSQAYDFYIKCGFKEFDHRYSQIDKQNYILLMKIF
jgi:ribosomal protein S18 acetylase RimI-like enzyme